MTWRDLSTGAEDGIGTIAFMAVSALGSAQYIYRPIHDCESIFWLCALELLHRVSKGEVSQRPTTIWNIRNGIDSVANAKLAVVMTLHRWKSEKELWLVPSVDLKTLKNSSLFFCLTALMREFVSNDYGYGYLTVEKGTDFLPRYRHIPRQWGISCGRCCGSRDLLRLRIIGSSH